MHFGYGNKAVYHHHNRSFFPSFLNIFLHRIVFGCLEIRCLEMQCLEVQIFFSLAPLEVSNASREGHRARREEQGERSWEFSYWRTMLCVEGPREETLREGRVAEGRGALGSEKLLA
jgi:hypothetical protein